MHPGWLSNSWLVVDEPTRRAIVIDTGGPFEPLRTIIEGESLELSHVLCTHHHHDHVHHNADYRERFGCAVCGHAAERELFPGGLDTLLADGDELVTGGLHVRALHIPGHTRGQLGFVINDEAVFTGDTLFRGSVGGTRAPGHTTFEDLRTSIVDVLMELPDETRIFPGHMDPTTVARERAENPFVLAWSGSRDVAGTRCTAFGEPAELLLRASDYDGGTKCWVRFEDGRMDVVPGSRVSRA
ncbi:MAG: MBL fold metallo-hydrolase [Planctomycetes bacterium]|nr:MBL fold metallo-hydrolase [Planctomycetota bacterium]